MKSYEEFNALICEKQILDIPMFSMFDHETHICNMQCDGNVNRYITTFSKCSDFECITTFCPTTENAINIDFFKNNMWNQCKHYCDIIEDENYHTNAGYLRGVEFAENFYTNLTTKYSTTYNCSDIIIYEGQEIGLKLLDNRKKAKVYVYWCPVCATYNKTRSFLEVNKEKDLLLFKKSDYVIVASLDQYEYLCSLGYEDKTFWLNEIVTRDIDIFDKYNPNKDMIAFVDYLINNNKYPIYLPYRISDEGYKVKEILDALYHIYIEYKGKVNFVVLCPNLNGDKDLIRNWINGSFIKEDFINHILYNVTSGKDTYYTLLDYGPEVVVPYFEDVDFIMHGTANELKHNKTLATVITNNIAFMDFVSTHIFHNKIPSKELNQLRKSCHI